MKKKLMAIISIAAIAVMIFGMLSSGAWFTDVDSATPNVISSATLSLEDAGFTHFNIANIPLMAPGDELPEVYVKIENNGNIPLIWFGDLVITGNPKLSEAVYIKSAKMEFLGSGWDEPTDQFITNGVGSGDYPGTYNTIAASNKFGLVGLDKFDGTSAMGVAPYEFTGALKPGYAYKLTLVFAFAERAENEYQSLTGLNVGFEVTAQQVNIKALEAFGHGALNFGWYQTQLNNQQ